jgi:S1-C subfamily serine protease
MLTSGYKIGESGKLGVSIRPNSTLVSALEKDGPASRAGVEVGDIITNIGDKTVANRREIGEALSDRYPYEKIKLTVKRGSKEVEIEVMLGDSNERRLRLRRR